MAGTAEGSAAFDKEMWVPAVKTIGAHCGDEGGLASPKPLASGAHTSHAAGQPRPRQTLGRGHSPWEAGLHLPTPTEGRLGPPAKPQVSILITLSYFVTLII